MKSDLPYSERIFIRLLEGNIPDRISGMAPEAYTKLLIEAIRFHEEHMHEADQNISFCHEMLEWYNSLIDEELSQGGEFWDDYRMYVDQMPGEIALYKEKYLAARMMKESCECELMRLLETYPGLIDKV